MKKASIIIGGIILATVLFVVYSFWSVQGKFNALDETLKSETVSNTHLYNKLESRNLQKSLALKILVNKYERQVKFSKNIIDSLTHVRGKRDESAGDFLVNKGIFRNLVSNLDSINNNLVIIDPTCKNSIAPDSLFDCNTKTKSPACFQYLPNFAVSAVLSYSLNEVKKAERKALLALK